VLQQPTLGAGERTFNRDGLKPLGRIFERPTVRTRGTQFDEIAHLHY